MGLRIAVLCSGRGTNLQAVLDAIAQKTLNAEIVGVFSDKPAAQALKRVPETLRWSQPVRAFDTREAYEHALTEAVASVQPDLVLCAGYMRILSSHFISAQRGRIINVHPSLLPKFPGLDTHQRALDAGETEHGATVHQVIPELDAGPVLGHSRLKIRPNENATELAARVLDCEHVLLIRVLEQLCSGALKLNENGAISGGHREFRPLQLECGG